MMSNYLTVTSIPPQSKMNLNYTSTGIRQFLEGAVTDEFS